MGSLGLKFSSIDNSFLIYYTIVVNMKYRYNLLEQLKSLPFFSKSTIYQLSEQYGLKKGTVDAYISWFLLHKEFFALRNGLYTSQAFFNNKKGNPALLFFLANATRGPSYVSSWTALQYYGLTTEVSHTVISVTTKVTRSYSTRVADFAYHSIKKELFSNFVLVKGEFDFYIASPAKALFDLLYFRTRQFSNISFQDVREIVADLRIDMDEMEIQEQEIFFQMVKKFTL